MSEDSKEEEKRNDGANCLGASYSVDASTDTSHTQLAQMTSSTEAPAAAADAGPKWFCEVCTYENFQASRKCTMCRSSKPLLGEDIFRLQEAEGASAIPSSLPLSEPICHNSGTGAAAAAIEERLRPLRISSPSAGTPPGAGASVAKWPCPTCTYENWPKSIKCAMCGAASSAPLVSVKEESGGRSRPAGRTKIGINELQTASIHELDASSRRAKRRNNSDWIWLQACLVHLQGECLCADCTSQSETSAYVTTQHNCGVVDNDVSRVEAYLASGGEPARALTLSEVALLNRASAFDAGHTLVHLAIRFQREDILSTLLSRISGGGSGVKRAPSYIAPDLATAIRRHVASTVRHKKGSLHCRYLQEFVTFTLPAEIDQLPSAIQEQLFSELLDREAQTTLEAEPPLINWSLELTVRLGSRLHALWNRSAGDCLLDAVMQAAWGVFDRDNTLRRTLADSLHHAARSFYERWHAWECLQAALLQYAPEEEQLRTEWSRLVAAAATPGTPLHQMHVFALAHVMRRPIIVYGVNVVNSYKGEAIGYARFQGVYLPLLWEPEFCSKSPLCLGYTRGHFSALVPTQPYPRDSDGASYICREENGDTQDVTFLPLTDSEGKLLPVHYLNCDEMLDEEGVLRRWLAVCVSGDGLLVAQQRLHARPLLVAQLLEEWLNHYRRLAQQTHGPFSPRLHAAAAGFSSDGDTDDE